MQAFSIRLYMNTILIYSKKSTRIQNTWHFYLYIAAIFRSFALLGFTNGKCSLWKLVNHFIWISYQPIRALRPNIGRMHVIIIGILAGSLSPREPARRLAIFSHFRLQTGNWQPNTLWGCQCPVCNLKWLKIENFARLYYPHFTTFRNETLEYY
jgi:hypothetical protein